ncbi:fasciclin domain-containing protein [Tabrizicola sp. BL-A-41-H6]|uniref:fasciclin domain-containing protein n=1 Tax=Tabrizicola sp. BL-A-41-H6 TaxID=3421107 RepID=UPI003D6751B8
MSAKFITAAALICVSQAAFAANPNVGGAPMYEEKNIVENAVNSADHTTLIAAVKAAGLVDALMGPGPFTVFAPVNDAFAALPAGTVDTLLKPENKAMLTKVLTAHVVAGDLKLADLRAKVGADGYANLQTLSGDALSVKFRGNKAMVYSESRNIGVITIADVDQSNGVIHVIDTVLVPK